MNLSQFITLISLAAIWGASFMLMRIAAPEIGPVALIAARAAIGFITLLPFLLMYKGVRDVVNNWFGIFVVGVTNTAIPFVLLAFATLTLSAGLTSILNATAPIFAGLVAFVWLKERLTFIKTAGLIVGFSGVVVLFVGKGNLSFDDTAIAIIAGLIAALNYGYAACYTKKKLTGVSTIAIATGSQFFAAIVYIPFLPATWPTMPVSSLAMYSTLALGAVCTALAYILYFRLIASLGPEKAITVAYLIPVFGVIWGVLFLQEIVTLSMLMGAALILFGVSMTTGMLKMKTSKSNN
ncbi:DMT family transporter [Thalassotalea nanhaiensis]|uniref:DMT family transporter n=1 Tax=Thalassotalea nanhaiensis TaxID=3065648 RepID=A0ABY9TLS6_9GAMM|nr:DMT family transporter [Colwelliaceae bacterium SQ345]